MTENTKEISIPFNKTILIDYTNWKNERSTRKIIALTLYWGSNEWHNEPQWLIKAKDLDKGVVRCFALKDIHNVVE